MISSHALNVEAGAFASTAVTKENVSCAAEWGTALYAAETEPAIIVVEMLQTALCARVPASAQVARETPNVRSAVEREVASTAREPVNVMFVVVPGRQPL